MCILRRRAFLPGSRASFVQVEIGKEWECSISVRGRIIYCTIGSFTLA